MGKSSTANHLFGANVAITSATKSETRSTTEFVLREDDVELGVKDLSLGVIDTPGKVHSAHIRTYTAPANVLTDATLSGFGDTEGMEQDACNLACIHDMLRHHKPLQSLSDKNENKLFPNVILLLAKATEKRFEGQNSTFSKALMAIK